MPTATLAPDERGTPDRPSAVVLDDAQRRVVAHRGGPLLVLAGPGTGKTTTIVELVAERVAGDGLRPEQVLVLTFSRRAADELRLRLARRLGRSARGRFAWTFHAWCLSLLRAHDPEFGSRQPRLLSGPEQDVEVRRLLAGDARDAAWPTEYRPLLTSRGFAAEVRDLLARCAERGVEPDELARLGEQAGRPVWLAAADFYQRYLQVLDWQGALDYAGLVSRAARLLDDPGVLDAVAGTGPHALRLVVVDEYQDTDPAQQQLLLRLAAAGVPLVAVGDPDQSIYAFRGADVAGILGFSERFAGCGPRPPEVLTLGTCRRLAPPVLTASRSVAARLPLPGVPAPAARTHRRLVAGRPDDGQIQVRLFESPTQEAAAIAALLRRAHLIDGVPWQQMAVLVRGSASMPALRRAFAEAGVPARTPVDEVPLTREPALVPLLRLLRVALGVEPLDAATAAVLLASPLGGGDPSRVRRLRQELRRREQAAGGRRRSTELLVALLDDPEQADGLPAALVAAPRRIHRLLAAARRATAEGLPAADALWQVWAGSDWRRELEEAASRHDHDGRVDAHPQRQLDAVVALFDAVGRFSEQLPAAGLRVFLDALEQQEIPADPLSQRGLPDAAVQLLTAHRAKGLEWELVVVAGVQEDAWPGLRRRSCLLGADELAHRLSNPAVSDADGVLAVMQREHLLVDERRLFYVACTRARRWLYVTAVLGGDGERQPSRFLGELGLPVPDEPEQPPRPLALTALVGELRAVVTNPAASAGLRRRAAAELARLRGVLPAADPDHWWGLQPWTPGARPLVGPGEAVRLSPSQVEDAARCPLRWFLERRGGARRSSSSAQVVGNVVHELARVVVETGTTDSRVLEGELDRVWSGLDFEAPWFAAQQRKVVGEALHEFLRRHSERRREVVGAEVEFSVRVPLGAGQAQLRGTVDRLERDEAGRAVVVDYKTGKSMPRRDELANHAQLGVYQLASERGAFAGYGITGSAGAELWPLRSKSLLEQGPLSAAEDGGRWVEELLEQAVLAVAQEAFPARRNEGCVTCSLRRLCPAQPEGAQLA